MSDSQAYEEVTLARDGVTVVKRFEEDEFPVPAIAFEFESDRDEEVTLRLVDKVPEEVAVEDLGFHPEYGSEYWTIDEDEITFERELGADEEYTTVYGIRATGTDNVEQFLSEPELADVDPPLPDEADVDIDDVIPESDDDTVREVISGEAEEVPGMEDDEEATDEDIETLDLKDPNEGEAAADSGPVPDTSEPSTTDADEEEAEEASADAAGDDGDEPPSTAERETVEPAAVDLDAGSLVAALATELRENNVSAEDVKLLRQAFEIAGQEGGSVVARIQRLQSDVADLRAYTDALEEFLDQSGTAQQVIEGVQSDIDELESQLDGMEAQLQDNADTVDEVATEVQSIEDELASVLETVDDVESDVDEMGEDVAEMGADVDAVSEEMADVREDVDDVSGDVSDVEATLDELEDEVEELRGQVSEDNLEGRLEEIESEVSDLRDWQKQIKSTFAG